MNKSRSTKSAVFAEPPSKLILSADEKIEHLSSHEFPELDKSSKEFSSKSLMHKMKNAVASKAEGYLADCQCAPDLYNSVLGPTADEAFLRGIQTVLNVCTKFANCDECQEPIQQTPEKVKSVPKVISEILESIGLPPELASKIVQTSFATLEVEKPNLVSRILQTSTPQMLSQILQTMGLSTEMISQIVQTSIESLEEEKPSMKSGVMQTTPAASIISAFMQTSANNLSQKTLGEPVKTTESLKTEESIKSKETIKSDDTIKTDSTKEEVEKTCICCQCDNTKEEPTMICTCCQCDFSDHHECTKEEAPPKTCVCCQCDFSPERYKNHELVQCIVEETPSELSGELKEVSKKPNPCICCQCNFPDKSRKGESILEVSKKTIESVNRPKPCLCCKCQVKHKPMSQSSLSFECIKAKFEAQSKLKVCRCYECAAPVLFRTKHQNDCLCSRPKVKCKCHSSVRKPRGNSRSYLTMEKGDTGSVVETRCCCGNRLFFD